MNVSLYQAAAAMNAHARWQELITQNLASSSVPGYRKQDISFGSVAAGIIPTAGSGAGSAQFTVPTATASMNLQPGDLRSTGNALDFAIEGPGFFEVQLPDGSPAYTRDGEFRLNAQGQLVTKQGHLVQSDSGPLQFDLNNPAPVTVSPNGDVSQGSDIKGRLPVKDFADPARLTSLGGGLFRPDDIALTAATTTTAQIRQGYLESANTSPTTEMASLLTAMRLFEANQKVLQSQDERMGRAISELSGER